MFLLLPLLLLPRGPGLAGNWPPDSWASRRRHAADSGAHRLPRRRPRPPEERHRRRPSHRDPLVGFGGAGADYVSGVAVAVAAAGDASCDSIDDIVAVVAAVEKFVAALGWLAGVLTMEVLKLEILVGSVASVGWLSMAPMVTLELDL